MSLIGKKDELFALIKSMSMSEKRYFKIFASRHIIGDKNNYIRLFEAIELQKTYDEEAIRIKFRDTNFVKQLAVTKTYLYKLILKAMRAYTSEASIDAVLKGFLADVDFLYKKGLYIQSSKILKKAKHYAYTYEHFISLLELLESERRATMELGVDILKMETTNIQLVKEKEEILSKLQNIDQYQAFDDQLVLSMRKAGVNMTKRDPVKYKKLMHHELLKNERNATSIKSKRLFLNSNAHIRESIGDFHRCYDYRKKMLHFVESHPEFIKLNPVIYINAYINFIIICCTLKLYREAIVTITHFRKLIPVYPEYAIKIFQTGYLHELLVYLETGQFEKAISIIPAVEKGMIQYKGKINKLYEIVFNYNIACIYIGACKYKEALTWNNKLLNEMEADVRKDVLSQARIINLIIHFELGNYEALEYLVKSTQRYLQKQKCLNNVEIIFLTFIDETLPKVISDKKEMIKALKKVKEKFVVISKNPSEKHSLGYFDFISWLETKIENRSFEEIVKEKARKNGFL